MKKVNIKTLIQSFIFILLIIFLIVIINKEIKKFIEPNQNMCRKIISYNQNSNYFNRDNLLKGWMVKTNPAVKFITSNYFNDYDYIYGIGNDNYLYKNNMQDNNDKNWIQISNTCCITQLQLTWDSRHRYGLGTNKIIYKCTRNSSNTYGPWKIIEPNLKVIYFIIWGDYIYAIGLDNCVYRYRTNRWPRRWIRTTKGSVKSIRISYDHIYAIGTDNKIYKMHTPHLLRHYGIDLLNYNWEVLNNSCCVTQIEFYMDYDNKFYIYGLGTDKNIYRFKFDPSNKRDKDNKLSNWEIFITASASQFFIDYKDHYIYAIGQDQRVYKHIINIEKSSCENFDNIGGKVDFKLISDINE